MLALAVIAAVGAVVTIIRYFRVRDDVPPMQRHAQAIEALRDLAEHPSPAVDVAVQPEQPIDHVRILDDGPAVPRRVRQASTSRSPGKPRRGNRSPSPATADRPTIQIRASAGRALRPAPVEAAPLTGAEPGGWPRSSGVRLRIVAAAGAAAVAIAVVAVVVGSGGNGTRSGATPTTAPGRTSPASAARATTPTTGASTTTVAPVVARTATGATVTAHAPFRLTLRATGTSWVQITDPGGTTLFATTMHSGDNQDIPVTRPVTLHVGYAPALTLSVDGVALDPNALAQVGTIELHTT